LQLGMGFLFVFLAGNSHAFIKQAIVNNKHAQGVMNEHAVYISAAISYGTSTLTNFISAPIVGLLGVRWAMVTGTFTHCIFLAGFLFLNESFLYFSSVLLGAGAAIIWTAQGKYIAMNSTGETAGLHSGLFWGLSQVSITGGGLLLYFQFRDLGSSDRIEDSKITIFYSILVTLSVIGVVILDLLKIPKKDGSVTDSGAESEPEMTFKELLYSTFNLLKDIRILLLAAAFAHTGIELSFRTGIYPSSISFTKKLATNTRTIMAFNAIAQGLGQATAGFLFGILGGITKKLGRSFVVFLGLIVYLIAFVAIYLNFPSNASLGNTDDEGIIKPPSVTIAVICAYLMGFGDACWNTQIFSFLVSKYNKKSAEAFSLFKFFQSLATSISFLYATHLKMESHILILIVLGILGFFGFFVADKLPAPEEEASKNSSINIGDRKQPSQDLPKKSDRKIYAA
ncbi:hypothetical protein FO519_010034, partial [Halicephalobus sp. NKZ332]